jgi:filamentous hemagglutinin family protein
MNFTSKLFDFSSSILLAGILLPIAASAQTVKSDGTLSTKVTSPDNLNFTITNGNNPSNGSNLFHSFSQFSVPTNGSASFDLVNTPNISTIFSRITGGNVSNIDGLIQTLNSSNPVSLFLLNPSGIIFGKNASLNIGGSFVGTTASSIKFSDGTEFSGVNPSSSLLLTIASPIGLNFAPNPSPIQVQGLGHNLSNTVPEISNSPVNPASVGNAGLQVQPGQTIALVGGAIAIAGGVVSAPGGRVEIGSVGGGTVGLNATATTFNYQEVPSFQDIQLSQRSLLNASSLGGGSIHLQGDRISLKDGSLALLSDIGVLPAGSIQVNASGLLEITGVTNERLTGAEISSGLLVSTVQAGFPGASINVFAGDLLIQGGGGISIGAYATGSGGDMNVNVERSLQVIGSSPQARSTTISVSNFGSGRVGNSLVSGGKITVLDGASISSVALATGDAGNVTVNAKEAIDLIGFIPGVFLPSAITSTTLGIGNASTVTVNSPRILLLNGGRIDSSTPAFGNSGNVIVNANDLEIRGRIPGGLNPSSISSAAIIVDATTRQFLGLPDVPTGGAGNVTVNTANLSITDGGQITVRNDGTGNAGTLRVNADSVFLDRQGKITASTISGEGGDINLQAQRYLLLRNGSSISATAGGVGNGGNIQMNIPLIVAIRSENSDIIANAFQGQGGNIQINTNSILGLKPQSQLTLDSDITASSEFGVSGTVNVNSLSFTPAAGLVELPTDVVDPSQRIAQGCSAYGNSRFVVTGRGGLPEDPSDRRNSKHPWTDLRDLSAFRHPTTLATSQPGSQSETVIPPIVEATNWYKNAKGKVELYATNSGQSHAEFPSTDCSGASTFQP